MLDGDVSQARGSGRIDVTGELLAPKLEAVAVLIPAAFDVPSALITVFRLSTTLYRPSMYHQHYHQFPEPSQQR